MEDLAFLRKRIESYADYTNDSQRVLTDEQIRAYVGEALSRLAERLDPPGTTGEELSQLVLRCAFTDQRVARALDAATEIDAGETAALHGADRELVTLADRAGTVAAGDVHGYLAAVGAALDRRTEVIVATPDHRVPAADDPR